MANKWRKAALSELTVNHDGKRKPVKGSDRRPGPYPYYGASGIVDYVDGYLFDGDYLLIAEDGENLRTRRTPIAFMARGKSWVNNHAHIVTGNDKADTRFLMYAVEGTDISGYLTGAVMPKLTQGNLNKIELDCPPLIEQHAIAHILGTLDDKIELNRKQNETLEAMARALFKAWFVDFEPVRAKLEGRWQRGQCLPGLPAHLYELFPDRLVESDLGEIPEGWEISTLGAVCTYLNRGISPKYIGLGGVSVLNQ
ncbi:restriction endonuclease subunit S [Pseudomonas aeruginosa]|nr:restriction endonuclease subunit S [Pseudomonas aeruginosa]NRS73395.1 restriction endonuclease subunit S [Pseudomonas aeruginosa]